MRFCPMPCLLGFLAFTVCTKLTWLCDMDLIAKVGQVVYWILFLFSVWLFIIVPESSFDDIGDASGPFSVGCKRLWTQKN